MLDSLYFIPFLTKKKNCWYVPFMIFYKQYFSHEIQIFSEIFSRISPTHQQPLRWCELLSDSEVHRSTLRSFFVDMNGHELKSPWKQDRSWAKAHDKRILGTRKSINITGANSLTILFSLVVWLPALSPTECRFNTTCCFFIMIIITIRFDSFKHKDDLVIYLNNLVSLFIHSILNNISTLIKLKYKTILS